MRAVRARPSCQNCQRRATQCSAPHPHSTYSNEFAAPLISRSSWCFNFMVNCCRGKTRFSTWKVYLFYSKSLFPSKRSDVQCEEGKMCATKDAYVNCEHPLVLLTSRDHIFQTFPCWTLHEFFKSLGSSQYRWDLLSSQHIGGKDEMRSKLFVSFFWINLKCHAYHQYQQNKIAICILKRLWKQFFHL